MRKHEFAECEKCPFENAGGYVPSQNIYPSSKIAVIGEAPGAYEAAYGVPFTGPSGKLLNQTLKHHGIERDTVMITNIVSCRPHENEDPPKSAINACAPRLHREIAESGIDTILAVGKVSSHALLDEKATMRKLRVGPSRPYLYDSSIDVISTWHPAFCLRSPDAFPDFVADIGKIRQGSSSTWNEPDIKVYNNPEIAVKVIEELGKRFDRFVLDIECGVDKDSEYIHPSEYPLLCLGIAFASKRAVVIGEYAINDQRVKDALRTTLHQVKIIAHNGKFDLAGLRNSVGIQELWFDTMLAAYCLDERPGHMGLKGLSIEQLGAPDYEQEIRHYVPRSGNYGDIPRDVLYKYNAYDVVCTWDLMELFERTMSYDDRRKHNFLVRASNILINLEMSGLTFDLAYNKELHEQFENELEFIENKMAQITGSSINPRSVPQVLRYYASKGLILPTTDKDFLKELCEKIDGEPLQFTEQLLLHRKRAKLYGTYVKGLAKRVYKDKVYTTFLLHGTTSGRLSSRNANLQNITREKHIRNQFTAENENNLLVQLDYKQAEGRVICTLAQDEYLREIFTDENRDLFSELCNDIFGNGKWGKEQRVTMKSIFYGNAYGREALSISKALKLEHGLDMSVNEVSKMMREFNVLIPGVVKWQAEIKHRVLSGEDLTTPYGRKRSFWLITDKNRKDVLNEALSFKPQSIASDICLTALINAHPMLEGKATMRLTIHDALIFESHRNRVDEVATLVKTEMIKAAEEFTNYVPFAVDISTGFRWGEL